MSEQNSGDQSTRMIPWVKSPQGVSEFYANMMHVIWSLDDVRLRLGQIVESPETPNPGPGLIPEAQERVAVTFTWRNAKVLRDQLTKIIENFENTNGPINVDLNIPPSIP